MQDKSSFSAAPIISNNKSGQITGVGGQFNTNGTPTSVNGGFYQSGGSRTFWGGATRQVSDSSSINMGGSVNNNGSFNASAGFTYRW